MRAETEAEAERSVSRALVQTLNESCFCVSLDKAELARSLERAAGRSGFMNDLLTTRPHLLAGAPVFLAKQDAEAMAATVQAIEAAVRLPQFRETALAFAPQSARVDHGPVGVFMGYDFHLSDEGPKLIEINTNAGGAFLNALLARAQRMCCGSVAPSYPEAFDDAVIDMFAAEWARQRGNGRPRRIAIVDDAPTDQYLYPEFVLAPVLVV